MAAKRFENPLLSDKRLREMFETMLAARSLGAEDAGRRSLGFPRNMEAAWVGSAIGLRDFEEEFASAGTPVGVLDLALGMRLRAVLRGAASPKRLEAKVDHPTQRIWFALGAALRMKERKNALLVYAGVGALKPADWKLVLSESSRMQLPIVFVAIPDRRDAAGVAEVAERCGVAGIPVDASDAVAMYRVAQESLGRARTGGGPALIEALRLADSGDPVLLLEKQLLAKRVLTKHRVQAIEEKVRRQVSAGKRQGGISVGGVH